MVLVKSWLGPIGYQEALSIRSVLKLRHGTLMTASPWHASGAVIRSFGSAPDALSHMHGVDYAFASLKHNTPRGLKLGGHSRVAQPSTTTLHNSSNRFIPHATVCI